ncbi:putative twinfilin [Blattamonas nauphoetae]|uniref:Twinfilin n=1 Tax=Blattamonas nauphoetae TaxID=2049346 RepID=A0ABQ9XN69_9EUKA|nr:putative twinfilin [Blattamonas nauphoetae]
MAQLTTKISPDDALKQSFADAQETKNKRYIKCNINEETIVETDSGAPTSDVIADFNSLSKYYGSHDTCYILFHLDLDDNNSWILMRYISERAQIKPKMLYSSSTENIKRELGNVSFRWALNGVEPDQMTLEQFVNDNFDTLTDNVKELLKPEIDKVRSEIAQTEQERMQDARERMEARLVLTEEEKLKREEARLEVHVGGSSSVSFPSTPACQTHFTSFLNGSINFLEITLANETLDVTNHETISLQDLKDHVDLKLPHFYLYTLTQSELKGHVSDEKLNVLIYSCPSGCPIRARTEYSLGKGACIGVIQEAGIEIHRNIESQEPYKDLTAESIIDHIVSSGTQNPSPSPDGSPAPSQSPLEDHMASLGDRPAAAAGHRAVDPRRPRRPAQAQTAQPKTAFRPANKVNLDQ